MTKAGNGLLLAGIKNRLPPLGKLRSAADFRKVREGGTKLRANGFDVHVLARGDQDGPRLGLAVSRRVGVAVVRNRWKRLLREFVRSHSGELGAVDLVVVPRQPPPANLWELAESFERAWRRFKKP